MSEPTVLIDDLYFPECMRWHNGQLWFSDMFAGTVNVASGEVGAGATAVLDLGDMCGGIGWLPDGDMLVVAMNQRQVLRLGTDRRRTVYGDLAGFFEYPTNDMYVDGHGRAYVGGYGYDMNAGAREKSVQLAVVEPDGATRLVSSPLVFPNGIDACAGASELLVAETFAHQIARVPIGPDGSVGEASLYGALPGDGPDGISCDSVGGVWVACSFGERVVHLDPSGEVDGEIGLPGLGVYDCLLGGPEGSSLFVAVASRDGDYARDHITGSILVFDIMS
jgi:sugar lactone lactonase YvrE